MNVLVVGNGSIGIHGGSEFFINQHTGVFLKGLGKYHSVTFAQSYTFFDKDNNLQNFELKKNKIKFFILPPIKTHGFLYSIISLMLKQDFIYLFYPGTLSRIVGMISILIKKPFGLYIRGQYYNQNFIDRFILKKSKFILTVSPSFAQDLSRFCANVKVIKPMIDIQQSDLNEDRNFDIPKKWNLLFVGRVEERKGIYELLKIAQHLKFNDFNFVLNIVGGGDLFEEVNATLKKYVLENNVVLYGLVSNKEQLKALYNDANAFIFTSHDEGFPRVLYEAMASGLPVFTTFVGGISGRMVHLVNCIEIPVKNGNEAGIIISKYLNNTKVLKRIGKNGLKTLEKIIDGSLLTHEDLLLKQLENEE